MSVTNVKTHPLAEILSKRLFAIQTVPAKEQQKMVARGIKAAVIYHNKNKCTQGEWPCEMNTHIASLESDLQRLRDAYENLFDWAKENHSHNEYVKSILLAIEEAW